MYHETKIIQRTGDLLSKKSTTIYHPGNGLVRIKLKQIVEYYTNNFFLRVTAIFFFYKNSTIFYIASEFSIKLTMIYRYFANRCYRRVARRCCIEFEPV